MIFDNMDSDQSGFISIEDINVNLAVLMLCLVWLLLPLRFDSEVWAALRVS